MINKAISLDIWGSTYKSPEDNSIEDTWKRIAKACSKVESEDKQNDVYNDNMWLLSDFKGATGGRITANIGVKERAATTLYNCFVHSPANMKNVDSIDGIYTLLKAQAHTLKSEGGYGMNFSWLRPAGAYVKGIGGRTPGVVKFMELWDKSAEIITMGDDSGKSKTKKHEKKKIRKGAQMGVLCCWHPEIEKFIDAKLTTNRLSKFNLSVGITKGFMEAVNNDEDWVLRFPDTNCEAFENEWKGDIYSWEDKSLPVVVYETIKAKTLWDKIMKATYTRNDPGVLFLDTANKLNPLAYAENIQTSNPCFHKDTLIAVADGRNAVSIKQLAEEGKDVSVYSLNKETGLIEIKMGRHPRITGYNKTLVRVTLDDGSYIDTTLDHNFILLDGTPIEAKDLKRGHSLPRFTKALGSVKNGGKDYYRVYTNTREPYKNRIFEHRLIAKFYKQDEWNSLYDDTKKNGFSKTGGIVIHHKDYNQLNNSPDNLQIMTFSDHSKLHGAIDQSGEKNGMYSGVIKEELFQHGLTLAKSLGRKFSGAEWRHYASKNKIPQSFSPFREKQFGSISKFAQLCVKELSLDDFISDPRAIQSCLNMRKQGYQARIENNTTYVIKTCEVCLSKFEIDHLHRETCTCSELCRLKYIDKYFSKRSDRNKIEQARIYSALKFDLNRKPMRKEWELKCKEEGIPFRVGNILKHGFKNFKEVSNAGDDYNHKVVNVTELPGKHTIYNITVDDNHTVNVITKINEERNNKWFSGISTCNCGEVLMGIGICLLFSFNLPKYIKKVNNKYEFDYDLFKKAIPIGVRLADNVNDISKTPLPEYDKAITDKRRIGLGVIGLGSLHYILGIRYGSQESLDLIENIFKMKAETELLASAKLGKEKGSFNLFDKEKYFSSYWWKNIPISKKIKREIEEIGEMRNSHHAANAPTGNMSLYIGAVSNGIEPVMWREYDRWVVVNEIDRIDLKKQGFKFPDVFNNEWFETDLLKQSKMGTDDILLGIYEGKNYQIDKNRGLTKKIEIEDYGWSFVKEHFTKEQIEKMQKAKVFSSVDDLSIQDHVKPLEIIAKYVNMNSSKTVNIPNDFKYEDFRNLYMDAWKAGIKGITSYRAGTMGAVLVNKNESIRPSNIIESASPKRPECISCDIHQTSVKGNKWTVLVGLLDDNPYEIFVGSSDTLSMPSKYKKGQLCKNGNGKYNLHVDVGDEELIVKNVVKTFDNPDTAWATRMISMSLRHGVPIQFIVEQLSKDGGMGDINKAVSRILKKYIYDGTKVSKRMKCPECGDFDFVFIDGCISCKKCTWSLCS